jgi:hypothetical protein
VGVGVGRVVVAGAVVVGAGAVVVAGAVVGAWTAGSDFSPQPAAATASPAAARTSGSNRLLPASIPELTTRTLTD